MAPSYIEKAHHEGGERKNAVMAEKSWKNMAVVAHCFSWDSGCGFCPSTLNIKSKIIKEGMKTCEFGY